MKWIGRITLSMLVLLPGVHGQTDTPQQPIEVLAKKAADEVARQRSSITKQINRAIRVFSREANADDQTNMIAQRLSILSLGRAAVRDLVKHLTTSRSRTVQKEVSDLLAELLKGASSPRHTSALLALAESPDGLRAALAWNVLGSTGDARLIPKARATAKSSGAIPLRCAALVALARLEDSESSQLWVEALASKSVELRRAGLEAIALLPTNSLLMPALGLVADADFGLSLKAIETLGSFPESIEAIRRLHTILEGRDQRKIAAALGALRRIDKRELSAKYIRDVVAEESNTYEVRYAAAQVLMGMGDEFGLSRLASPIKRLISKQPKESGPRRSLGQLYFEFGKYSKAIKELERFLATNPPYSESTVVNLVLARSEAHLKHYKRAANALSRAGRGYDWGAFASMPEFREMAESKRYSRYFSQ